MRPVAIVLVLVVFAFTGCAGSSHSPIPDTVESNALSNMHPQVWQRGSTPVQWQMLVQASKNQLEDVYSWPITDGSIVAFGTTCCYPGGTPPQGTITGMNISGTLVSVPNGNPKSNVATNEAVPMPLFPCAQNTQICSTDVYFVYGPNGIDYEFNNQSVPDAVQGSGSDVWFTTCCNYTYIVHGVNGSMHFYRTPDSATDKARELVRTADGSIWATLQPGGSTSWVFVRLNPTTSAITQYPLALAASPAQLLLGPDGNIWFTLQRTLYRLSASNAQITRFTLPQPSNGYLTVGPGSTIWTGYFNTTSDQGLIELNDSGTLLGTFACPVSVCVPDSLGDSIEQLTRGPDGNVWFAYSNTQLRNIAPPDDPYEGLGVYVLQAMNVQPNSVTLTGPNQTQTITISEANYSGKWTADSTQASVVKIVTFTAPNKVEIESVGAGSGRVIIHDSDNNYYGVTVTVQ